MSLIVKRDNNFEPDENDNICEILSVQKRDGKYEVEVVHQSGRQHAMKIANAANAFYVAWRLQQEIDNDAQQEYSEAQRILKELGFEGFEGL